MYGTFAEHTENNTNYSYNGRNRRSRKDTCNSATASSNIRKTQDPAGNTGSDVGTHDDTDRLLQLHHTGVYKTDDHDRRGG